MKTIKEIFDDKINKDKIYNYVTNEEPKSIFKWYYPVLITSLALLIIMNIPQSKQKSLTKSNDTINIYSDTTNSITNYKDNNYTEKEININDIDFSKLYNHCDCVNTNQNYINPNINIPKYNVKTSYKAIYIKEYNNKDLSLYSYKITYDYNDNKYLSLTISKDHTLLYNMYNKINTYSIIDDINVKIIKIDNNYIALFSLENFNLDIETNNISEKELISFIKDIINNNERK